MTALFHTVLPNSTVLYGEALGEMDDFMPVASIWPLCPLSAALSSPAFLYSPNPPKAFRPNSYFGGTGSVLVSLAVGNTASTGVPCGRDILEGSPGPSCTHGPSWTVQAAILPPAWAP